MEDDPKTSLFLTENGEHGEKSQVNSENGGPSSSKPQSSPNDPSSLGKEIDEPQLDLGSIFSTRTPKDAVAGVSSGLKSMGKGVLGGVASLIALPIAGAREEVVFGFAKGLGLG